MFYLMPAQRLTFALHTYIHLTYLHTTLAYVHTYIHSEGHVIPLKRANEHAILEMSLFARSP